MAKRRVRRKSNPEHGSTLLVIGGVAVVGYLLYSNGFFNSFGTTAAAPATTGNGVFPTNPITAGTTIVNAPPVTPPLGTAVNTPQDLASQIKANYPYIIPGAGVGSGGAVTLAPGYSLINTTDSGPVLLRGDVASAVQTTINNRLTRAGGASIPSLQQATDESLAQVLQVMSTQGLSGLGNFAFAGLSGGAWG